MGENHREKFHYNNGDYNGLLWCVRVSGLSSENTPRVGVNRYMANLMTNDTKLKTKCNTLCVTKLCSRIPGEGLWTNSSKFL